MLTFSPYVIALWMNSPLECCGFARQAEDVQVAVGVGLHGGELLPRDESMEAVALVLSGRLGKTETNEVQICRPTPQQVQALS